MDGGTVMKKHGTAVKAAILAMVAAGILLAATACENPVANVLTLTGTWGSSFSAVLTPTQCGLLRLDPSGSFMYSYQDGSGAVSGTYTLGAITVSGSTRTYQIKFTTTGAAPVNYYVLAEVSGGTKYESVFDSMMVTYPSSLSAGSGRWTLTRQ
jgi:hypothetical protein